MNQDPVYAHWKRTHPKFPGVSECVELLRRRNVQGAMVDIMCRELRDNAADHAAELIAACRAERDQRVRRLLLATMCEAKLSEALPVFKEHLGSHDEGIRYWSEHGLRTLNNPEA